MFETWLKTSKTQKVEKFTQPAFAKTALFKDSEASLHMCICKSERLALMYSKSSSGAVGLCVCVRTIRVCVQINKYTQLKASCYLVVEARGSYFVVH